MIDQIQLAFRDEVEIRFGIGLGEILTAIDPKLSIGADGPAYWEAPRQTHEENFVFRKRKS